MSLREKVELLEDQYEVLVIALTEALQEEDVLERDRLLRVVYDFAKAVRADLRLVAEDERRRPRLRIVGVLAPAGAGGTLGALWARLRRPRAVTAAAVGGAAAAALAIGVTQLPDDGTPDGSQARPTVSLPAPAPTPRPQDPAPEDGGGGEPRPSGARTTPADRRPPEARTDPRTLGTTGARPGAAPTGPDQPGPTVATDDETPPASPDPSEPPDPTDPPGTQPPDPTDPPITPPPGPGGLLCLDVDLGLVDLDLCLL